MTKLIAILPGDGIGPEIIKQAVKLIDVLKNKIDIKYEYGFLGGAAYDKYKEPYPKETQTLCKNANAILLGAVGSPKYDNLPRNLRPERGLLAIRKDLNLFANLRPSILYEELIDSAPLKKNLIENLDLLIVRELTGDIYFGSPRGIIYNNKNEREGFNTMRYSESEIIRIAHVAFKIARNRNKKLCSVDKANVLETTELWREVMNNVHKNYQDVELTHMYVDNAAMQLVKNPKQFDVIVTGNIFGDILSDLASMLTGSIGMLASASLNESNQGLYEPAHGSAPDIAKQNKANPIATILSLAMLFKYSLKENLIANSITNAIKTVLKKGYRTQDIYTNGTKLTTCEEMGDLIVENFKI